MLWVETPTNPMLKLIDILGVSRLRDGSAAAGAGGDGVFSSSARALVCVDNTFGTPYFQRPLALGADIVVHSTTKYIGGHSDVIGGVAITNDPSVAEAIKFHQNAAGGVPGPQDAWLTMRGAKTLACACASTRRTHRRWLSFWFRATMWSECIIPGCPRIHNTIWRAPDARFRRNGFVRASGGAERAFAFAPRLEFFSLAESLGGVESLISNPARMTHGAIPKEERVRRGVVDGLLRLSVGIEDVGDLIEDLRGGLDSTR